MATIRIASLTISDDQACLGDRQSWGPRVSASLDGGT
jgi:hypothetical protein